MSNDKKQIYLDYAASHPLSTITKEYITSILDVYGNPSSLYELSDRSRQILFDARQSVADFVNAKSDNIYFTCSGSASNCLGIKGYMYQNPNCHIYYSPILHKSILKCLEDNAYPLNITSTGLVVEQDLDYILRNDSNPYKLVVIDYANSEIGTIQNVEEIVRIAHKNNATIMIDATGSISQIPLNIVRLDADIVTFSGHKLGALKGVGVLYKKSNIELKPIIYGSQEKGLFGGTENIIGIASLGKAIEYYDYTKESEVQKIRDTVWSYIKNNVEDCYLIGEQINSSNRLNNNLYICFKGVDGEILMSLLSNEGICVSTGSACNSGNKQPSTTLTAIKLDEEDLHSCLRITMNYETDIDDAIYACSLIKQYVQILRES